MAITTVYFPWGALLILLVPPICWSRYVLRKHTPAQMAGGIIVGFVLTAIIFILLL
jgi:membrane-associated phospholipid phosphatase